MKLEAAFGLLCPSARETALLRACLLPGEAARAGWRTWLRGRNGDDDGLCTELAKWRTLLSLLARSAGVNELDVGCEVMTYLRATTAREELRSERFVPIAASVMTQLEGAGVRVLAVRGAALAATDYGAWALRHCHDFDLLVDAAALDVEERALLSSGFVRPEGSETARGNARVEHTSGLQVSLHSRPFAIPYYDVEAGVFERGARSIRLLDRPVESPSPEATLVHGLGHASYSPSRRNLRWVTDAWHILERHRDLDWSDVLERIADHRLDLPVFTLVEYLARFGMAVLDAVVAQLRERAARADRVALDVALGGLMAGTQGDVFGLWRSTRTWPGHFELARWAVAPTREYLRMTCGVDSDWLLPLFYVYRPVRFVAGQLARRAIDRS